MSTQLRYDMPGVEPIEGSGDSLVQFVPGAILLTDQAGFFTEAMVGCNITIAGATNPLHNGTFAVVAFLSASQIAFQNVAYPANEAPFSGTWSVAMVTPGGGPILCYDAGQVEDDVVMLSGPHDSSLGGGSTPPGSWPDPGDDDVWDGPYGPPVTDWTNASHPGVDLTQGGYSPPNRSWHYDSQVPAGWYSRVTKNDRYRERDEIPPVSEPII